MHHLRQLLAVATIICALSCSAFAGDMNYPVAPSPTPTASATSTTSTSAGTADPTTAGPIDTADTSSDALGVAVWSVFEIWQNAL